MKKLKTNIDKTPTHESFYHPWHPYPHITLRANFKYNIIVLTGLISTSIIK